MSIEAERQVIGGLLLDNEIIDKIPYLEPEMFEDAHLGRAFHIFAVARQNREDVSFLTLVESLRTDTEEDDDIFVTLRESVKSTYSSTQAVSAARIVWNQWRAKRYRELLDYRMIDPTKLDDDIDDLLAGLTSLRGGTSQAKTLSQIVEEYKGEYFCERNTPSLDTGLPQLDEILSGMEGGDLIIIGARPAVGKSAFAAQLTLHFAESGKKVGYFNLEMQEKQIYERFVASVSGLEMTRIRRATNYQGDEEERFSGANERLLGVDNVSISTGSKKVSEIRSECLKQKFDVVIIDYMQLVKSDIRYGSNRYAEVGAISHAAKALAMDMNIPVIGLCQLNRLSENREDREPSMGELRESGDFEQDASVILLLWNSNTDDPSEKCIKVEKQRQGRLGKVRLRFDGSHMRFSEISPDGFEQVMDDLVFD